MFGARVVAQTHTRDLPQLARFLQRALLARNASISPAARVLSLAYRANQHTPSRRSYATTTKATKPTATVKKAVKKTAATKAPARKTAAAAKPQAKKAPAAAARKTTTRKAAPRKAAAKKKPGPKKAAPRKRVKKVLTPEAADKAKKAELKKRALREPVSHGVLSAFNVYVAEQLKGTHTRASTEIGAAGVKFRALTAAEHEHYNHLAHEQTAAKRAEYQAWIRSFTPLEIEIANRARAQLRTKYAGDSKSRPAHTGRLIDDRHVKRALTPYNYFFTERMSSRDFKGIKVNDSGKLIAEEWKALTAGEKKKYEDMSATDKARHDREKAALA